jgi:hypothetical protein
LEVTFVGALAACFGFSGSLPRLQLRPQAVLDGFKVRSKQRGRFPHDLVPDLRVGLAEQRVAFGGEAFVSEHSQSLLVFRGGISREGPVCGLLIEQDTLRARASALLRAGSFRDWIRRLSEGGMVCDWSMV